MAEKNQVQPTGEKKGKCGCGCIGNTQSDAQKSKPAVEQPEK